MSELESAARKVAMTAHAKQTDKTKVPYWHHLKAVADGVRLLGGTDEEIAAAWLHDILEDTPLTAADLTWVPLHTIEIVKAVTKRNGERQEDYLERVVKAGRGAMLVKVADLLNNTRPDRLAQLPEATQDRLLRKYRPALARLLLELGLIASEGTQEKLATKPVGSSGGWWVTSGKNDGGENGPDGVKRYDAHELLPGDWPLDWSDYIVEKKRGTKATYHLADGTSKTAFGKTWVYTQSAWQAKKAKGLDWKPRKKDLDWKASK
jgi:hypothetical protein